MFNIPEIYIYKTDKKKFEKLAKLICKIQRASFDYDEGKIPKLKDAVKQKEIDSMLLNEKLIIESTIKDLIAS